MGMVEPEAFDGKDILMVYVAGRVSEGKQVEQVLSDNGLDYAVDVEPFQRRVLGILPVNYEGVGFYVLAERAGPAREALRQAGLLQGLVEDDPA